MEQTSIPHLVDRHAEERPDDTFLITRDRSFTYAEFQRTTRDIASAFHDRGLQPGDHIAVAMTNRAEYLLVLFAAARLESPVVTVDTEYAPDLVEYAVDISDSTALVYGPTMAEEFRAVSDDGRSFDLTVAVDTEPSHGAVPFDELRGSSGTPPDVDVAFDSPFHITFSSGTTGDPKPILLNHHFWTTLARTINDDLDVDGSDRYFANLTLAHGNPYLGIMSALVCGGSIALGREFSGSRFWDDVRRFDATAVITHVTTADILLKQDDDRDHPAEVASFLAGPQAEPFMEKFGIEKVMTGYGSMEAGGLCSTYPATLEDAREIEDNLVGWDREGFRVEVVDDDDNVLPADEVGEIVVRPEEPSVMFDRYYNMPEKTVDATRNLWYHSGDLGFKDAQGRLHFLGRADDSIRVRGHFVPIERVETTVKEVDGVEECAIVGVSADIVGDEVKAYVKLEAGADVPPERIVDHCREHLASYMVPRYVEFVEEFPRSEGIQKIQRNRLAEWGVDGAWDREAN